MDERIDQLRRMWWTDNRNVCAEIVSLMLRKIAQKPGSKPGPVRLKLVDRVRRA